LLTAEIFIRWGDWFARDFAVLYVVSILTRDWGFSDADAARTAGWLLSLMALTALATYIPLRAGWIGRSRFSRSSPPHSSCLHCFPFAGGLAQSLRLARRARDGRSGGHVSGERSA
jgi:hypothetical protein